MQSRRWGKYRLISINWEPIWFRCRRTSRRSQGHWRIDRHGDWSHEPLLRGGGQSGGIAPDGERGWNCRLWCGSHSGHGRGCALEAGRSHDLGACRNRLETRPQRQRLPGQMIFSDGVPRLAEYHATSRFTGLRAETAVHWGSIFGSIAVSSGLQLLFFRQGSALACMCWKPWDLRAPKIAQSAVRAKSGLVHVRTRT